MRDLFEELAPVHGPMPGGSAEQSGATGTGIAPTDALNDPGTGTAPISQGAIYRRAKRFLATIDEIRNPAISRDELMVWCVTLEGLTRCLIEDIDQHEKADRSGLRRGQPGADKSANVTGEIT